MRAALESSFRNGNRRVRRVGRQEVRLAVDFAEARDRKLCADFGDDDVAHLRHHGFVDREQVAVPNAEANHAVALCPREKSGLAVLDQVIEIQSSFLMICRRGGKSAADTGRHQWQCDALGDFIRREKVQAKKGLPGGRKWEEHDCLNTVYANSINASVALKEEGCSEVAQVSPALYANTTPASFYRLRMKKNRCFFLLGTLFITAVAMAKSAEDVYRDASPGVVVVLAKLPSAVSYGSGVVVARIDVVTNCHVIDAASRIAVVVDKRQYVASVRYANTARDLCQLQVAGLRAHAVKIASATPRIGQRVYAIGNPEGLERTLSEGLISSIRDQGNGTRMLQTTVPITHGSSGGGLFDSDGRLVGITTSGMGAADLNFAIPAEAIAQLPASGKPRVDAPPEVLTALSDSVQIALENALNGVNPPEPKFDNVEERIKYLHWLAEMSNRLKNRGLIEDFQVRREFLETVWYEGRRAGLDPALVLGLVEVASNFRKYYVSLKGAHGYMAVMPFWTTVIGDGDPEKLFHMQTNLRYGCSILRMYLDMEGGNLFLGLGRYVGQRGRDAYPNAVLKAWKQWEYRG